MVRIITDSAADFEHSESEKFGISTIPLAVYIDGKEYKDDFLHSKERFYRLAKKNWRQYMQSEMRNANFCYQKRRLC